MEKEFKDKVLRSADSISDSEVQDIFTEEHKEVFSKSFSYVLSKLFPSKATFPKEQELIPFTFTGPKGEALELGEIKKRTDYRGTWVEIFFVYPTEDYK